MLCDQLSPDTEKCCANCIFRTSDLSLSPDVKLEISKWCKLLPNIGKWKLKISTNCQHLCTPGVWSLVKGLLQSNASSPPRLINRPCFSLLSQAPDVVGDLWGQLGQLAQLVVNDFIFWLFFTLLGKLYHVVVVLARAKSLTVSYLDSLLSLIHWACETASCTLAAVFELAGLRFLQRKLYVQGPSGCLCLATWQLALAFC